MHDDTPIFLVGFMGTGKTTVGRQLAERLGRPFVDLDAEIEARAGKPISAIFRDEGEAHFRALERAAVQEVAARRGIVAAAGGGAVLDHRNTADLLRAGLLVCLMARPEVILARVQAETHRPLLEQGDKERRIIELLEQRLPIYRALPIRVDTSDLSPNEVVERVLEIWRCGAGRGRTEAAT